MYGLGSSINQVINSFLLNRSQCVVIEGQISDKLLLTSGVPQGSVLAPLLFIVYINDLTEILSPGVTLKLFADKAKLYSEIKTGNDIDDLQICLDNFMYVG